MLVLRKGSIIENSRRRAGKDGRGRGEAPQTLSGYRAIAVALSISE